ERVLGAHVRERSFQVLDIAARRVGVAHADRRIAHRRLPARAPGVAEHALREIRKIDEILVDERVAGSAESLQTILHIRRITRLAHLAVVDDVDPRLRLLAHDVVDRVRHASLERLRIDRNTFLARIHRAYEVLRPRQAAGMRRQESPGASSHRRRNGFTKESAYYKPMPAAHNVVAHLDMDAFYASVELLRYPELRGKPVVIGGGRRHQPSETIDPATNEVIRTFATLEHYAGRGVITTATYEARALGLHSAMAMMKAAALAPQTILLPVDFDAYRHYSRG